MVLEKQKKTAKKKGFMALGALIVTPILWYKTGYVLGIVGLGTTVYLTWDWLKYRGKWGLKF